MLSASGTTPLAPGEFEFANNLDMARLTTTVHMFDRVSQTPMDVSLDLAWKATSPLGHQNSHYIYDFQRCHSNSRYDGAFRFARVSATVSDGRTNFGQLQSAEANIRLSRSAEVSHGCG
jgi:hypothetical protein